MRSPGRQQQQTQPPVLVVQQPVVVDSRRRTYPFLLRGARFSDGCKVPGQLILTMVVFGAMCSFMGIVTTTVTGAGSSFTGIPMLLIGIGMIVPGMWLCVTAKRQFDDLPSDHPHRLKYGTGYRIPVNTFNNTTTYAFPAPSVPSTVGPNAGYPVMTAGQAAHYPVQATGQTSVYPYPHAGQSSHTMPAGGQTRGYPPGGRGSSPVPTNQDPNVQPSAPEQQPSFTDPPPPYSEISKDSSFKPYA